ncbi:MAG: radical SAM protein [Anaerolineae bacterium]|nr:radical SAM protein [Anaerolineae bacterium]
MTQMGDVTLYEPAGEQPHSERPATSTTTSRQHRREPQTRYQSQSLAECISNVATPSGAKPILKTMLTTACERNCNYCPFRAGRGQTKRFTLTPDELAKGFDQLQRARLVDGLFLSSGIIKGSIATQDKLIDTIEIIRQRYRYRGFIHLKIMPGAQYDQVKRAMKLADRISVNLEGATHQRLEQLAPKKNWTTELLQMLLWTEQIRQENPGQKLARAVTQFVVGAVGDTDLELLSTSERLFNQLHLARVYFSGFGPVMHTPFENLPATDPQREFRLYQASFLLRDYGWNIEEMPFAQSGNMRLDIDPKKAWAEETLLHHPIEVMTADRQQLLRVPGIGPVSADAIISARRQTTLRDLAALRRLGVRAPEQSAPYILLDGHAPDRQMKLF